LAAAVASVREQAVAVREIIIIDDGSTDDTATRVPSLGPVRYVHQANAGPAAARNAGLNLATGEWIAFLDADDRWTPHHLGEHLAALARYPELVLLAGDMAEVNPDGHILTASVLAKHGLRDRFLALAGAPLPNPARALLQKNFIPTGTVLVKAAVARAAGGFPAHIRWGEDLALWVRIATLGAITCLPEVHMLRLQHGANATAATQPMLAALVEVARELRQNSRGALAAQGVDIDRWLAEAYAALGYFHFDRSELAAARPAFSASLREQFNTRALYYRLLCCLPAIPEIEKLSYENIFRITIVQFLDRFNFCVGNVKRSCIHFVTPEEQIIPFDTYNLFYRNNRIGGIRRRLDRVRDARRESIDA
jgi:glycosyltransferase involved in cell wall biosynthesis